MLIKFGKTYKDLDVSYLLQLQPDLDHFNLFVYYLYILCKNHITKGLNFILVKTTLLKIGKEPVFLELIMDPAYSLHVQLNKVFGINQDVFQIYDDKNIKFFNNNFIGTALEAGRSIKKSKRHDLILKLTVLSLKSHLLFIVFTNSHLVRKTSQV